MSAEVFLVAHCLLPKRFHLPLCQRALFDVVLVVGGAPQRHHAVDSMEESGWTQTDMELKAPLLEKCDSTNHAKLGEKGVVLRTRLPSHFVLC